jgi:hypothetical protein
MGTLVPKCVPPNAVAGFLSPVHKISYLHAGSPEIGSHVVQIVAVVMLVVMDHALDRALDRALDPRLEPPRAGDALVPRAGDALAPRAGGGLEPPCAGAGAEAGPYGVAAADEGMGPAAPPS